MSSEFIKRERQKARAHLIEMVVILISSPVVAIALCVAIVQMIEWAQIGVSLSVAQVIVLSCVVSLFRTPQFSDESKKNPVACWIGQIVGYAINIAIAFVASMFV